MIKLELLSFYRHKYDSEWHLSLLCVEYDFEYGESRSLLSVGKKDELWFIDLFWTRLTPKLRTDDNG